MATTRGRYSSSMSPMPLCGGLLATAPSRWLISTSHCRRSIKNSTDGTVDYLNHALAIVVLLGTIGYVWVVLKPFKRFG